MMTARRVLSFPRLIAALVAALVAGAPFDSLAQRTTGIGLVPGNAAVTGFSGAIYPPEIAPGADPAETTFVDLDGAALRIVDLQHMGGPPAAQLVGAPKPFTVQARQVGQVFGVAFDNANPPNVYVAASSAYGLPIVAPGPDGKPRHVKTGAPNAAFMPGLWGTAAKTGGPGSIWRIDGATGAVTLFANTIVKGRQNSGPALGGLAFDPDSRSLFVADRETGFIDRFALNRAQTGRYDHGTAGRAAQGLPPAPFDPAPRVDVTSGKFDSTDPTTWNLAPPARRVFGIAIYQHRLYYAVADGLQIWSVGLTPDGSFANDAMIELQVPPASGPVEISKITFDSESRMLLAERPAPTGAFDFGAIASPAIGRVLRYAVVGMAPGGRRVWQEAPDEFAVGFAGDLRNGNGGVEIGYQYDGKGDILPGSCGGFLWETGEQLRKSADPALAAKLGQPTDVDGLQGNGEWQIRHDDEPPLKTYFIDYDDRFDDDAARGHLGDLAILRNCSPARSEIIQAPGGGHKWPGKMQTRWQWPPGYKPPPPRKPPPGACPPDQVRRAADNTCQPSCPRPGIQIGDRCCQPGELAATEVCSNGGKPGCSPGEVAVGPSNSCCSSGQVYTNAAGVPACCSGTVANGQCSSTPPSNPTCPPGSADPKCCANGYVSTGGSCCLASQLTPNHTCCPAGETPGGKDGNECIPRVNIPRAPQCCPAGEIPAATTGKCCAADNLTTSGVCCPTAVDPNNRTSCPEQIQSIEKCAPGYTKMPNGTCCSSRLVSPDGKTCRATPPRKVPPRSSGCPAGTVRDRDGDCVSREPPGYCPPGTYRDGDGECVPRQPEGGPPSYQPPIEGPRNPFPGGQPPGFQPPGRSGPPAMNNPGTFAPGRR